MSLGLQATSEGLDQTQYIACRSSLDWTHPRSPSATASIKSSSMISPGTVMLVWSPPQFLMWLWRSGENQKQLGFVQHLLPNARTGWFQTVILRVEVLLVIVVPLERLKFLCSFLSCYFSTPVFFFKGVFFFKTLQLFCYWKTGRVRPSGPERSHASFKTPPHFPSDMEGQLTQPVFQ